MVDVGRLVSEIQNRRSHVLVELNSLELAHSKPQLSSRITVEFHHIRADAKAEVLTWHVQLYHQLTR